jgi:hypothetical protein
MPIHLQNQVFYLYLEFVWLSREFGREREGWGNIIVVVLSAIEDTLTKTQFFAPGVICSFEKLDKK